MKTNRVSFSNVAGTDRKRGAKVAPLCCCCPHHRRLNACAPLAQAAAGDLDSRFGNGGVVATDFLANRGLRLLA